MKRAYKLKLLLIMLLATSALMGASKSVMLQKGWNQLSVPLDHIKIDLLLADANVDVIWAYQNGRYHLASKNSEYLQIANRSFDIEILKSLSYGESIYVLAKDASEMIFVGQTNTKPPVRSNKITSMWRQVSRNDFASVQWNVVSRITQGHNIIAAKIVMEDNRPSLRVYSSDPNEAAKISANYFEDFEVGEHESFWVRDVTNLDTLDTFSFALDNTPSQGGELIKAKIKASSSNKNKHFLVLRIVALKDGNTDNKEYVLFDDYIPINQGDQSVDIVMPMLLTQNFGNYTIYAIADLAAQYDKEGIDIYNRDSYNEAQIKSAYTKILQRVPSSSVNLSGNSDKVSYSLKMQSREYANSIYYYDPLKELNRIAKNQAKDISNFGYLDLEKHAEFQFNLQAFGNSGKPIEKSQIKAYLHVNGTPKEVIILGGESGESHTIENMKVTLPDEINGKDIVLPLMLYGTTSLKNSSDATLYNDVLSELSKDEKNKICLDEKCSQWIYKKSFELSIAVAHNSEPTQGDILATTSVTLVSETFGDKQINDYESSDTTLSLMDLLLDETIYNNANEKRAFGKVGGSEVLIDDLTQLKSDLKANVQENKIFDPLQTLEQSTIDRLLYSRDDKGGVDYDSIANEALHTLWSQYTSLGDVANNLCDRKNYFKHTVPYTKTVNDPDGGEDIRIATATQDLCLYNIKQSYLETLPADIIEQIAQHFRDFVRLKNSVSEDEQIANFWNPLFAINNDTIHIPQKFVKEMPIIGYEMGGGVAFSSKLALDSELNELRANAYVDVDAVLIKGFKLVDLDFETVISASDSEASRFDLFLYTVDLENITDIKKVYMFSQQIQTHYTNDKKIDTSFAFGEKINFTIGVVPCFFEFEVGAYLFIHSGIDLDFTDHFSLYAVPGVRLFGSLAGGLSVSVKVLDISVGVKLDDFTIITASVPVVASLEEFRFDREGLGATFKVFGNLEMKVAEISVGIFANISIAGAELIGLSATIFSFNGIDPLKLLFLKVGEGEADDVTECQSFYRGWEIFCIKKELALEFEFDGLTRAQCSLLDKEYARRKDVDNDTSFLYLTSEYRKVRGCINDSYEFESVTLEDWQLTDEQMSELSNDDFWKWDSRATINRALEEESDKESEPEPWAGGWEKSISVGDDPLNEKWKELVGY